MSKVLKLEQNLKRFNLQATLDSILREFESVIIDLNTENQLFERGIDANGEALPMPYAPFTVDYKQAVGQPTDRITLRDTGEFHSGFFVRYKNKEFSLWSSDGKTEELIDRWGEDIFGLTEESLNELIWGYIYPELMRIITKEVFEL